MAMKGNATVSCIGRTIERSGKNKDGKFCFTFVDGERLTTGLYVSPTCLTFWTNDDLKVEKFGQQFEIVFEVIGEAIVVRSAAPAKESKNS